MKLSKFSKVLCLVVVMVLVFGLFVGCGERDVVETKAGETQGETKKAETDAPKKSVTITVAASQNWVKDIDKKIADEYAVASGNKVEFQLTPDDQYENVLKTKLSTGEAADIFMTIAGLAKLAFLPEENMLDLSDQPWVARYKPWAKEGTMFDGKTVQMLTWSSDGWAMLYNNNIFADLGLSVPTNYVEFLAVCEAISNSGITPIFEWAKDTWHTPLWINATSFGLKAKYPGLYDGLNDGTQKYADIPELVTTLIQLKELADLGYMGEDYMSNTWDMSQGALAGGQFAMALVYTSYQNEVKANFPETNADEWGMFPSPLADNTAFATSAGGIGRAVYKKSKNIETALDYLNYLAQDEVLADYYINSPTLSEGAFFGADGVSIDGIMPVARVTIAQNSPGGAGPDFQGGTKFFGGADLGAYIQDMFLGGKTPVEVLEQVDIDRAQMFELEE